jgi:Nickel responsive protein SCO4226-like
MRSKTAGRAHGAQQKEETMPRFLIERTIPGAGSLSAAELRAISQKSCGVLRELGPAVQWVQSYVTADKVYCVYVAPHEAAVREHARRGGFPVDRVSQVTGVIDPTTAE